MGNFSKPPLAHLLEAQAKGYVGLYVEQGVPVLDRDLNLLGDLISATLRQVVARYIGSGVPSGNDGFAVLGVGAVNSFQIAPGTCLVGGIEVTLASTTNYAAQSVPDSATPPGPLPALTTPTATQPNPRQDTVYLDVWLEEITSTADATLGNPTDVGMQTSVRQRAAFLVRVQEAATDLAPMPAPPPGHVFYPLATLLRPLANPQITAAMVTDRRSVKITVTDIERRLAAMEKLTMHAFAPSPNQFSPKIGIQGTTVTLSGRNFNLGTLQVFFGTIAANVVVASTTATQIVVTVPAGVSAGPLKISITRDTVSVVSDDTFTVLPVIVVNAPAFNASPNQFSPKVGVTSTTVTLFGTNFDGASPAVSFGGTPAAIQSTSATQIVVKVPSLLTGSVTITATTSGGTTTSTDMFTVL